MLQNALASPVPEEEFQETMPEEIQAVEPPRPASSETNTWDDVLPEEFKDEDGQPDQAKIDSLAVEIYGCIQGAIEVRDPILERIAVNEPFYHNRPPKAVTLEPYPGAPNYHWPLVGPRLQQRKASWVDTITSPDKYFYLTFTSRVDGAQQAEEDLQDDFQFMLRACNFDSFVSDMGELLMPCGIGTCRATFYEHHIGAEWSAVMGPYAGFKLEAIHPNYFLTYPANNPSVYTQKLAGHEFELRVSSVEAKQRVETWMPATVVGSGQSLRTQIKDPGLQQDAPTARQQDQFVHLGDFLVKYAADEDGEEKTYRVIADTNSRSVYRIEPYDDMAWYVPFRIVKPLDSFWPEDSPANDGQSANMMLNALGNNGLWGIQYSSRQSVIGRGMPGQDSMQNMPPGAYIPVNQLGETQTIGSNFTLAGMDFMMNFAMRLGDMSMKVPDTITGGSAKDETATAQQIKYQGFQLMGGADIKATNPAFIQLAQVLINLMYDNWTAIQTTYGDIIKTKDREILKRSMIISVAGQKPKAAPQIQQAELSAALHLIQTNPILAQNPMLQLELTEKFVNQTGIEGKEDLVKVIAQSTADMGQWFAIIQELKNAGFTPDMLVKKITEMTTGASPNTADGGKVKMIMNYKDTTGDVRENFEEQAGLATSGPQQPVGTPPQ